MSDLAVGDIVKLKSHPQELMVQKIVDSEKIEVRTGDGHIEFVDKNPVRMETLEITCVWIDDYGQPHREVYAKEVLEISNPDPMTVAMRNTPTKIDTEGKEGL